jgi:hypothetical protein
MKRLWFSILLILATCIAAYGQARSTVLTGVWRVTERTPGPNASINRSPQPGLIIFTGGYYCIMTISGDKPRPSLPQDPSKASAAELLAVFGPFTANAGSYEIKGQLVTTHPMVAKGPAAMEPSNSAVLRFQLEGNTLTLTQVSEFDRPVENPTTVKLIRVE